MPSSRDELLGRALACCLALVGTLLVAEGVAASNAAVGLQGASRDALSIPRWLYVATGGATIGASALLASFVTDRRFVRDIHRTHRDVGVRSLYRVGVVSLHLLGLVGLVLVAYSGLTGPRVPTVNFAVVVVFAGLRAGLTMVSYAVGNVWPALNPWRTVAARLPNGFLDYPARFGRWPAVVGLLGLVWMETTTGITSRPRLLGAAVVAYSLLTVSGALAVGAETWFRNVDPVSVFFRFYGRVAPFSWDEGRLRVHLPGMRLVGGDSDDAYANGLVTGLDDAAIAVALVWELTFSGFVTTRQGAQFVRAAVGVGVPPLLVYGGLFVLGFLVFYGAYLLASRAAADRLRTHRTAHELAVGFAPPLLAIAAGYHLAHYFGFFVSLAPSLVAVVGTPLSPPANPLVLTLPAWFSALDIVFVLGGHVLAVWVAHSIAYRLFPSRMQAIRSQFPFVFVMVGYTAASLWLISLPTAQPPFLP
ncbi:hypothetical protein [Halopelagius longus]|uniref:Uncharacterized protein n=1 Tax=Halopelagius longus TaxID=1236180 RepID=A0A1H0YUA4_9EURY|nr:hypothetical protein [Halopelagius longus]RDI72682.1 hypothetical protein DWB78_13640 [Halopelagius longus]SDQ18755.1 hypothetical protein SAMN05216278_0848 [Halopelagius longus]